MMLKNLFSKQNIGDTEISIIIKYIISNKKIDKRSKIITKINGKNIFFEFTKNKWIVKKKKINLCENARYIHIDTINIPINNSIISLKIFKKISDHINYRLKKSYLNMKKYINCSLDCDLYDILAHIDYNRSEFIIRGDFYKYITSDGIEIIMRDDPYESVLDVWDITHNSMYQEIFNQNLISRGFKTIYLNNKQFIIEILFMGQKSPWR